MANKIRIRENAWGEYLNNVNKVYKAIFGIMREKDNFACSTGMYSLHLIEKFHQVFILLLLMVSFSFQTN